MAEHDLKWVPFRGTVATTHPVDAYGGVRLSRGAIDQMVDQLNAGGVPITGHHDATRPVRVRNVLVRASELEDGEYAAVLEGEVVADDWEALGDVRGFSFATAVPLPSELWNEPDVPELTLAADAAWFATEDVAEACRLISPTVKTSGNGYLQFSSTPIAKIVLEFGPEFLVGLAASELSAAIHYLLRRRRTPTGGSPGAKTVIEARVVGAHVDTTYVVSTNDPEVATRALEALPEVVHASDTSVLQWVGGVDGEWTPPA